MESIRSGRAIPLLLLIVSLFGCASTVGNLEPSGSSPGVSDEPDQPESDPPPGGPRALPSEATFGDLVAASNSLDDLGQADSESTCMVRAPTRQGWPWLLELDLALAVRPLPTAPGDLDVRLDGSPSPVLAITRWGQLGSRSYELALAAFSNTPPPPGRPAIALALTNRGVYLRRTDQLVSAGRTGPTPAGEVAELVAANAEPGQLLIVTAEAEVLLDELYQLLGRLPETSPIALAVALDESIHVPDPPPPSTDRQSGLCPGGLDELPAEARGQLEPALIVGALGPLRQAVATCMAETAGARAAGGLVELMMRISEEGQVSDACMLSDELGGPQLRDCLIRAARATTFPRPRPAGAVDVSLPLRLQPSYQRPLCQPQ